MHKIICAPVYVYTLDLEAGKNSMCFFTVSSQDVSMMRMQSEKSKWTVLQFDVETMTFLTIYNLSLMQVVMSKKKNFISFDVPLDFDKTKSAIICGQSEISASKLHCNIAQK